MALKKLGELLQEIDFDSVHHELTMELKQDMHMVQMCRVLYDGLKDVTFTTSRLKYALVTNTDTDTGRKLDKIVAYADFLDVPMSIQDLEPNEIVSTEVMLEDPDLEPLFLALCLVSLCEEDDKDQAEDDMDMSIKVKSENEFDLGEKEYDEDSLFPFKKNVQ